MSKSLEPNPLDALPFVAPCAKLDILAPLRWLRHGWRDFRQAWRVSAVYGLAMAAIIAMVCLAAWRFGSYAFAFAMIGGFVFLAPLSCTGLYAVSAQLERNESVSLRRALRAGFKRYLGNEMVFALVLLVIFLVWARAGAMVHIFFPANSDATAADFLAFLSIGSIVGAIFATITFSASAFSLPMIVHRRVDAITAVVTSVNAVLRNKRVMLLWLLIVMTGVVLGLASAGLGLIIILPVIGHAAWHGYLETIDASAFPRHDIGITAKPRPYSDTMAS